MNSDFMIFNFLPEHQISKRLPYSLEFYKQENFNSSKLIGQHVRMNIF